MQPVREVAGGAVGRRRVPMDSVCTAAAKKASPFEVVQQLSHLGRVETDQVHADFLHMMYGAHCASCSLTGNIRPR